MVKIRISYDRPGDLQKVERLIRFIGSDAADCRQASRKPGDRIRRVYIILKE